MLKIDGSLARYIVFEVANVEVPKKTRRKTSILKLHSVKISGSLARNARFAAPTCLVSSLWFSCGLAVSVGGSCKTSPFQRFPGRLSFRFAWQVWHFRRVFFVTCGKSFCVEGAILFLRRFHKMSCSFRGSRSILKVSKQVVLSFCVAGAALCGIPTCMFGNVSKVGLCGRRSTFASFSKVFVAGATLWRSLP